MRTTPGHADTTPTGHLAWRFRGRAAFEGLAAPFLFEGLERRERLLLVSDDPRPSQWPTRLLAAGQLVINSTTDVYGPTRLVNADEQHATFRQVLADAIDEGYYGLRVIADNTSLIDGPERLDAWLEWEARADLFMAENPVTGLCAFDETRARPRDLAAACSVHDQLLPDAA
jgi:hypothetical protein